MLGLFKGNWQEISCNTSASQTGVVVELKHAPCKIDLKSKKIRFVGDVGNEILQHLSKNLPENIEILYANSPYHFSGFLRDYPDFSLRLQYLEKQKAKEVVSNTLDAIIKLLEDYARSFSK